MELVRAHHAVNLIALPGWVVMRDRLPEAGNFQHHFRAVLGQESMVVRSLVVVPNVIEDRRVDVPLIVAEVGLPLAGERIEVGYLSLFSTFASALPWEHRAAIPRRAGGGPRLVQAAVSVHQKATSDFRQPNVEKRECVDFVPEDVTSVGLPVKPAGRQPSIEISGMNGAH